MDDARAPGGRGLYCRFETADGPVVKAQLAAILHPPLVKTAAKTALVVGVILSLINHGDALLSGRITAGLVFEMLLTFAVPYGVATYGAVSMARLPTTVDLSEAGGR